MPFLTATTVEDTSGNPVISTTGFDVALERSETQQGTVSSETVAWACRGGDPRLHGSRFQQLWRPRRGSLRGHHHR